MLLKAVTSEDHSLQSSAFWSVFVSLKNVVTFLIKHYSLNRYTKKQSISSFSLNATLFFCMRMNGTSLTWN